MVPVSGDGRRWRKGHVIVVVEEGGRRDGQPGERFWRMRPAHDGHASARNAGAGRAGAGAATDIGEGDARGPGDRREREGRRAGGRGVGARGDVGGRGGEGLEEGHGGRREELAALSGNLDSDAHDAPAKARNIKFLPFVQQ